MKNPYIKLLLVYLILVAGILTIALSSSCHRIHDGRVIERIHEPAEHYTYTTYNLIGKVIVPVIHSGYDDEDFILVVNKVKNKERITEKFYVNEQTYNCKTPGTLFNDSVDCQVEDDRIEQ